MKKIILGAVIIIILAGALVFYFLNNKKQTVPASQQVALREVDIIVSASDDTTFFFDFASEKGFFAKNNLIVKKISVPKDVTNVLVAEGGDLLVADISGPLSAYLNGAQTKVIAGLFRPFGIFGVSRYDRKDFSKIKKAAGNSLNGGAKMQLVAAMKNLGIDPEKTELVAVPSSGARVEMMKKGEVDFAVINLEKELGGLKDKFFIFDSDELFKGSPMERGLTVTVKGLEEKTEEIKIAVKSFYEALAYADANPGETEDFIAKKYEMTKEEAEQFYREYIKARSGVSFVPQDEFVTAVISEVRENFKIESEKPARGFISKEFAEFAVKTSER